MRTGDSREKIHREFALRPLIFKFLPGPLFVNQFRLLPKARFLLMQLTAGELVRDDHIKVIIFHPLSELCVGEFFPINIAQSRIAMLSARRLGDLECEDWSGEKPGSKN